MAIINTKLITTSLGIDLATWYIRVEVKFNKNGTALVSLFSYASKASYSTGSSHINNMLPIDLGSFTTGILSVADSNIDNIHDLAIAELVARGEDVAKLSKADLV